MRPTAADRVSHIKAAIAEIQKALRNETLETFSNDVLKRMAVERLFEVISEASRNIPPEVKAANADISWHRLADLGNTLRHAYFRVESRLLWNFAQNDLEPLRKAVESFVASDKQS